jgi:SAM-dependent methyltransferase
MSAMGKSQKMNLGDIPAERIQVYYYNDDNAQFDYELYKKIQIEANIAKIDKTSINVDDIKILCGWLNKNINPLLHGLCHGTRAGIEQKLFTEYTGAEVLGTDISPTASQFPNTIQHDFHDVKDEWVNFFDFIFSNSYDHSYNLEYCINQWIRCLRVGGVCILEHADGHRNAKKTDPLGILYEDLCHLLKTWGQDFFSIKKILNIPLPPTENLTTSFRFDNFRYIIIEKMKPMPF